MNTTTYEPRHAGQDNAPGYYVETVPNSAHPDRWAHDVTWHATPTQVRDVSENTDLTSRDLHLARDGSLIATLFLVGNSDRPLWSWGVWVTDPLLPPF